MNKARLAEATISGFGLISVLASMYQRLLAATRKLECNHEAQCRNDTFAEQRRHYRVWNG